MSRTFMLIVSQNPSKYFHPSTVYKVDVVKKPDELVRRYTQLNATGLQVQTSIAFGRGHMQHKDDDLITW